MLNTKKIKEFQFLTLNRDGDCSVTLAKIVYDNKEYRVRLADCSSQGAYEVTKNGNNFNINDVLRCELISYTNREYQKTEVYNKFIKTMNFQHQLQLKNIQ